MSGECREYGGFREGGGDRATGKRGRRQQRPDPADGPVAEFAHALCELKEEAGDPSYDRMRTEFGAIASKSALSAAARGRDLPSWETTWEFVRSLAIGALGQESEAVRQEWSERWEKARFASTEAAAAPSVEEPAAPRKTFWRRPKTLVATAVVAGGVGLGVWLVLPPTRPVPGDASVLVGEAVPDGTPIRAGESFVKTWEVRNVGQVRWKDRYLEQAYRQGDANCTAPQRVSIAVVEPGQLARLSVPVEAGGKPGQCKIAWKMVDGDGRPYFPTELRPVFLDVTVLP
jgi:hypothetical protein